MPEERCAVCGHLKEVHAIPVVEGRAPCYPDEGYVPDGDGGMEEVWVPCDCTGYVPEASDVDQSHTGAE